MMLTPIKTAMHMGQDVHLSLLKFLAGRENSLHTSYSMKIFHLQCNKLDFVNSML
jgi:hypothetical protein